MQGVLFLQQRRERDELEINIATARTLCFIYSAKNSNMNDSNQIIIIMATMMTITSTTTITTIIITTNTNNNNCY